MFIITNYFAIMNHCKNIGIFKPSVHNISIKCNGKKYTTVDVVQKTWHIMVGSYSDYGRSMISIFKYDHHPNYYLEIIDDGYFLKENINFLTDLINKNSDKNSAKNTSKEISLLLNPQFRYRSPMSTSHDKIIGVISVYKNVNCDVTAINIHF